jgi:hypothetical protein
MSYAQWGVRNGGTGVLMTTRAVQFVGVSG